MAWLNVLKDFRLNLEGSIKAFKAGLQEVEDEVAQHWYVREHSEPLSPKQAKALQAVSEPDPAIDPATVDQKSEG